MSPNSQLAKEKLLLLKFLSNLPTHSHVTVEFSLNPNSLSLSHPVKSTVSG